MNSLSARIKERMKALNMTQEMLAHKMGITRGAVTHYLAARRTPPLAQFNKLAAILKVDPAWLHNGTIIDKTIDPKKNTEEKTIEKKSIPILTWEQVAHFVNPNQFQAEIKEYVPNFFVDTPRWYALRIKNDVMTVPIGNHTSFKEKDIIIVDPDKTVEHGNFIIALLPRSKEATFKQYVIDGGASYLKPLNPQYPITSIDKGMHVCGVVIHTIVDVTPSSHLRMIAS